MRDSRVVALVVLVVLACACNDAESPRPDAGSVQLIEALGTLERRVEDVDVCQAIRDGGAEDDLEKILGVDSVNLESSYSESEDALAKRCEISAAGPRQRSSRMAIAFFQGTEFKRAAAGDPVVFAGCRIAQKPPATDAATRTAAVRATCGRALTVDIEPEGSAAIPPWTQLPRSKVSERYVDLLHDVLVGVASHD